MFVYLDKYLIDKPDEQALSDMGMDDVFKALADPTRRRILRLLQGGEMTAGQLAEKFEISAPSMSHHFGVLKQADLVSSRREGQQMIYTLNTTVFQEVLAAMVGLFAKPEGQQ